MSTPAAIWLSVLGVSLVSLAGAATLALDRRRLRSTARGLMSFAVGALLGDAFLHLVPSIFAAPAATRPALGSSLAILAGMLLFFVVEKLVRMRSGAAGDSESARGRQIAVVNVLGDALHNAVDGAVIAASWMSTPTLGIATTIAVLLHEIPQELGDFGVLVHSGIAVRRALLWNLVSASTAFAGAGVTLLLASSAPVEALLPIAAGGFDYIAAADLIPELHARREWGALVEQVLLTAAGVAVMAALKLAEA